MSDLENSMLHYSKGHTPILFDEKANKSKRIYAMSGILQNHFDENNLIDCVQRFFIDHVGKLLAKCNIME